jgi:hypothetical protein
VGGLKGDWKTAEGLKGDWKTAEGLKGDWKTAEGLKGDWKTAEGLKGDWETAEGLKGDWKTAEGLKGDWKTAEGLKGDWKTAELQPIVHRPKFPHRLTLPSSLFVSNSKQFPRTHFKNTANSTSTTAASSPGMSSFSHTNSFPSLRLSPSSSFPRVKITRAYKYVVSLSRDKSPLLRRQKALSRDLIGGL